VTMITTENVAAAFDEVAPSYDLMVALNPDYHAQLRAAAEALAERLSGMDQSFVQLLDLGCGSGASTHALLRAAQAAGLQAAIVGLDASAGMIKQASAKDWPLPVRFRVGQAEEIGRAWDLWGIGDRIHRVFAAYLFRNVANCDVVLAEVFDLLADDGALVVKEYSIAGSGLWAFVDVEVRTVPGWQRDILHTFRARKPATDS
jgi:ubiquinone/menaquinone biosynthesis C-methylase UbiE